MGRPFALPVQAANAFRTTAEFEDREQKRPQRKLLQLPMSESIRGPVLLLESNGASQGTPLPASRDDHTRCVCLRVKRIGIGPIPEFLISR